MSELPDISEIESDSLMEIFNIGVGHAAAAMSSIVNEEVRMSVPTIRFAPRSEAADELGAGISLFGISQHYEGAYATEAILMFPEEASFEIVRMMVGDMIPAHELGEMEREAMSEIGNIVLNACVGTLANMFQQELQGSLPVVRVGSSKQILNPNKDDSDPLVMMLRIDFSLERQQIQGYLAFILDMSALRDLREQIRLYISRLESGSVPDGM
ncbi:chemotaxis protein CheC [Kosakonia oryzendophytica]|uniref:Chemotaxis protein CheC n=1 Tax=Kosakonia oryzendophytica TaxID=1005665 RepID=A0A1C4BYA7_9ENTR|nr:chemotaxis protein CheC [Kosakonia oryzendophytica]TDT51657.1 chemotaxis protein CheC [Enterobacter sp. AG5470]WBT60745.1 chemotaxis protein CheC [Kosakonia oryzendophytica]SCC11889.1 chemotaxis protein CheC [Kosakonia oryzendophytica]